MQMIIFAIKNDWGVLSPILICSLFTVAVFIERWRFYRSNRRDIVEVIQVLQNELHRGNLAGAARCCNDVGGLLGEVAQMGVRTLAEQKGDFERQFDITTNLATRRLERYLPVLGTIATISPYLGLFGTVVRILLTFGEMAQAGGGAAGGAPQIMAGIGSALIATAFGLGVAITAVAMNNYFHTVVARWEEDFQLLKLLFLSQADRRPGTAAQQGSAPQMPQQQAARPRQSSEI
jgi:biopolymer transport protein ExbB